jgi:predicted TIM-barrel fold metal-dependent hydrolase
MKLYYPTDARYVLLPMDFEHAGVGGSPQSYLEQLKELAQLARAEGEAVYAFVAADPRREGLLDLVRRYVEDHGFAGIKVYPPLGYFPFDEGLLPVYRYAQERGIPVLAHCSRGGVYYKGKITWAMCDHPLTGERLSGWSMRRFAHNWTDPRNWDSVAESFPELRICLAHFGGEAEWKRYWRDPARCDDPRKTWFTIISDLIKKHENVYADVSFTAYYSEFWPLLKVLLNTEKTRDRILFGSDFYMVRVKGTEKVASISLRAAVGEPEYRRMAEVNPRSFLGLTSTVPEQVVPGRTERANTLAEELATSRR